MDPSLSNSNLNLNHSHTFTYLTTTTTTKDLSVPHQLTTTELLKQQIIKSSKSKKRKYHHQQQQTNTDSGHSSNNEHENNKKSTSEKRKAQNRTAQKNFRERKEKLSKENEENLLIRTEENKQLRNLIERLEAENAFLRQHVPVSVLVQLSVILPSSKPITTSIGSVITHSPDQEEHTRAATALSSLASATPTTVFDPALQDSSPTRSDLLVTTHQSISSIKIQIDPLQSEQTTQMNKEHHPSLSRISDISNTRSNSPSLQTETPFTMPAHWASFWNTHFPTQNHHQYTDQERQEAKIENETGGGAMPGLRGKDPDEKVEAMNISKDLAQPKPQPTFKWTRPPDVSKGEDLGNMLQGIQAWSMIMSHPRFHECDQEELARALQSLAKCANGNPVISKDDVMVVWNSMTDRANANFDEIKMSKGDKGQIDQGD
ncbi:hypothetical protein CROQUDRAFT_724959 [Cronartium quercuum f. sp. fusiforme G11]|uniref:BZIP domain-containing protein n=1 Tax=Cronartium quercuum f. sp. fusiforme G11 TaxID=708437 RepID=A0A9P6T9M8_9BASI|nr:hypothetical protein CROQUDRAFT_724959 [Cronartium quercuum f. sp. fusiforme G11]